MLRSRNKKVGQKLMANVEGRSWWRLKLVGAGEGRKLMAEADGEDGA